MEPPWYWVLPEFDDSTWGSVPSMSNTNNVGLGGNLTLNALSSVAGDQQWCRSALAQQPDVLTLWDSRYTDTKITRLLPKGAVTQFQITGYSGSYYHVLTSTSLIVVSSRTEDYDARPVPAASKNIVGFRSARMYAVPAYADTKMSLFYYRDNNIKDVNMEGGMSKTNNNAFTTGRRYYKSGVSQFQCDAAVFLQGTDLLGAAQWADYDGLEATPFVRYYIYIF